MHVERQLVEQKLARAWQRLQQGDTSGAESLCRRVVRKAPQHGGARHLLGLVRKAAGDRQQAEQHMRASIELAPAVAEYHANLGNLLREAGRGDEAEACYRRALELDPGSKPARIGLVGALGDQQRYAEAEEAARELTRRHASDAQSWSVLGNAVRDAGRLEEAESLFRKSLAIRPGHAVTRHNLGSLLSRMERAEEALEALGKARDLGVRGFEIDFNFGRTFMQLNRFEEAEAAFEAAVEARPRDTEAQVNLARIRYMQGEEDFARAMLDAARRQGGDPGLERLYGVMLQRAGDHAAAERQFRALLASEGPVPEVQSALAASLHETGQLDAAVDAVREAVAARPEDAGIADNAIAILLAIGDAEAAMTHVRRWREREPHGQGWLAYEATAARLLGDPRYEELYDYDRLVQPYDVEPPAGWSSIEELNAALETVLAERHRFRTHPLDQSLRHGSQTARSMLTDPDPAIRAIVEAFRGPIEEYRRLLGSDPRHPISSRNRGAVKLSGAWSVRLRRKGFHVNHVHPEGWISSAYYVSLPAEVEDKTQRSGWIKFGEPRYPVPGADAERYVKPRAGRLVLFPSYMWHGTTPIHGDEARTTIAFDAVPADEPPQASV